MEPFSSAIALLVSSAPQWAPALKKILLTKGQDVAIARGRQLFDEQRHLHHVELALRNAAERGLARFQTSAERDQYRAVLAILARDDGRLLREEGLRLFTLSDAPNLAMLSEKFDLAQRTRALGDHRQHEEVDAAPYLSSFFEAFMSELFSDPLFRQQMGDTIQVRAALSGQRSLEEVVGLLRGIGGALADDYPVERFEHNVATYVGYVESQLRHHKLLGIPYDRDIDMAPELAGIFVPLKVAVEGRAHIVTGATDVQAALREAPYLVLLGGPGSGKSITTRYVAWLHARANGHAGAMPSGGALLPGKPIPLRIELRLLSEARRQRPELSILSYAAEVLLAREDVFVDRRMFEELLNRRLMFILFDGLDEVPTLGERQALVAEIEGFAQRYPGNRMLVTSRPVGYQTAPFSGRWFEHGRIRDFDDAQIRQFLDGWYRYVLKYTMLPADEQKALDAFYKALQSNANLHRLATNPLMLTVMTAVHRFERLPDKRVQVYDKCADLLLNTWAKLRQTDERWKDLKMGTGDQKGCLAHLGFVLHRHAQERLEGESETTQQATDVEEARPEETAVDVPVAFIEREMREFLKNQDVPMLTVDLKTEVERFLELVQVEAGLLVERGKDERGEALFGFVHRTFQEYFAACDLDNRRTQNSDLSVITAFLDEHLHNPHWHEVTLLLLARLPRKLTTDLLERSLGGTSRRSVYAHMLHQDLFFVAECLGEDMDVRGDFAEGIVEKLGMLVRESPFPTLARQALVALGRLLQTRQYAVGARGALVDVLDQDHGVPLEMRMVAAEQLWIWAVDSAGIEAVAKAKGFLFDLAYRSTDPILDVIAAAQSLHVLCPEGSEEHHQAVQALVALAQREDIPLAAAIRAAQVLYYDSPFGSEERQHATQALMDIARRPNLSIPEATDVAPVLYGCSEFDSDASRQATRLVQAVAQRPDLSGIDAVAVARALLFSSHIDSDERRQAMQMLLAITRRPDVSVTDAIAIAKTIYDASIDGTDESRQALQTLLDITQRPDVSVTDAIAAAQARFVRCRVGTEEERQAAQALLDLVQRPGLSPTEAIAAAQARLLIRASDTDRQQVRQALLAITQRLDVSPSVAIAAAEVLYDQHFADAQQQAMQVLHHIAGDEGIPAEQRLRAATVPLRTAAHHINYCDRLEAVKIVLRIVQGKAATERLAAEWRPTHAEVERPRLGSAISALDTSNIPAIAELADENALPTEVRDRLYELLYAFLPWFDKVDGDAALT